MAGLEWQFTVGDVGPPLRLEFKDANDVPQNLTGYTVTAELVALKRNGGVLTLSMTPDNPQTGSNLGWATFSAWTGTEFSPANLGAGNYHLRGVANGGGGPVHYPNGGGVASAYVGDPAS